MDDMPIPTNPFKTLWKQAPESFLANALFQLTCFIYPPYAVADVQPMEDEFPEGTFLGWSFYIKLCIGGLLGIPIYILWLKCAAALSHVAPIEVEQIPDCPEPELAENADQSVASEVPITLAAGDQIDVLHDEELPCSSGMQRQGDVVPETQPIEIAKPTLIGKKIQFKCKPQNQSRSPRSTLCRSSRQELTSMYNRHQQQQRPIGPINQMNRNQQRPINQLDRNQQQSPINLMNRNRIYPAPTPPQSPRQLVNRKQMAKKNGDQPNWHR